MYSLLLTFFAVSIIFSFLCSLWEAVLLSITPHYAQVRTSEGAAIGRHLEDFKLNIDRPLAAILTLNTIAHTAGAIGVGDQAARIWADANPIVTMFIVPAVMTLAILVLSEIVPKTIGAVHWQRLAPFTVHSLRMLMLVLAPFVWMSQLLTRGVKQGAEKPVLTRNDFLAMTEIGAREGVFEDRERHIISNLLGFGSVEVRDVMTPRTVVAAVAEERSVDDFYRTGRFMRFSRIPTFHRNSVDQITGYVLKSDVLVAMIEGRGDEPLSALRRDIVAVGERHSITDLFRTLMERQEHVAMVVDDFGGMAGIVTMEDAIETLLGLEIVDETDATTDMRVLAQRHRNRRARALGLLDDGTADRGEGSSSNGEAGAEEPNRRG
jgi:CBS domain containing-hemolysin-like protein